MSLLTLAALMGALALGTPGARGATPDRVYLIPSGDTYTSAVSPHHSFGRATKLRVDAAPRQNALLRFNLSGVDLNRFSKATLYLYPLNSSPRGLAIRRGSRRYWHEAKLTYSRGRGSAPRSPERAPSAPESGRPSTSAGCSTASPSSRSP